MDAQNDMIGKGVGATYALVVSSSMSLIGLRLKDRIRNL